MKIENNVKSPGSVTSEPRARPSRDAAPAAGNGAQVQLSALSSHLQKLEQTIADTPVVDSGKVQEIKDAISQGQFRVNPDKVADGLLDSVRQMLAAQTPAA